MPRMEEIKFIDGKAYKVKDNTQLKVDRISDIKIGCLSNIVNHDSYHLAVEYKKEKGFTGNDIVYERIIKHERISGVTQQLAAIILYKILD